MNDEEIEKIMSEVNEWELEDLRELSSQIESLADSIECDQENEE